VIVSFNAPLTIKRNDQFQVRDRRLAGFDRTMQTLENKTKSIGVCDKIAQAPRMARRLQALATEVIAE
jgi:hypothetical protein